MGNSRSPPRLLSSKSVAQAAAFRNLGLQGRSKFRPSGRARLEHLLQFVQPSRYPRRDQPRTSARILRGLYPRHARLRATRASAALL
jgi:hypothetical protein